MVCRNANGHLEAGMGGIAGFFQVLKIDPEQDHVTSAWKRTLLETVGEAQALSVPGICEMNIVVVTPEH